MEKPSAIFDPGYSFLYLPQADWGKIAAKINERVKNGLQEPGFFTDPICTKRDRIQNKFNCIFQETCDNVRQKIDEYNKLFEGKDVFDIGITIKLNDGKTQYDIELSQDDMLVGGQQMDDARGNKVCYLPFFVQDQFPKSWIIGTIIMHKYYVVYDRTPFQYDNLEYNRIGIAKKNPVDLIGQKDVD